MKASVLSIFVFLIICKTASGALDCPVMFQGIKDHTACLPRSPKYISGSVSKDDMKVILDEHNKYRASVEPPACKMLKLYWDDNLAYVAQQLAENCKFEHDKLLPRSIPGSYIAGQNLGSGYTSWKGCIAAWYGEKKDFVYNVTDSLTNVGHFTQMIWETTAMIGCGYAKCNGLDLYVCNYGPSGNNKKNTPRPYEKCSERKPLKDCKGKFCKNGGVMKPDSCDCDCKTYKHIFGPDCSTNCTVKDIDPCNKQYQEKDCIYSNVPAQCPWMCKTCPFITQKQSENKTSPKPTTMWPYWSTETSTILSSKPTFPGDSGTGALKHSMMSTLSLMALILMVMI